MQFEWDEGKRRKVLAERGIDFNDAVKIFLGPVISLPARSDTELRMLAIGDMDGTIIAIIYTMRGEKIRIITARRARRYERENYGALFP